MTEQCTNIKALPGIDGKILPTESTAPRPAIVKNHGPTTMSPGSRQLFSGSLAYALGIVLRAL